MAQGRNKLCTLTPNLLNASLSGPAILGACRRQTMSREAAYVLAVVFGLYLTVDLLLDQDRREKQLRAEICQYNIAHRAMSSALTTRAAIPVWLSEGRRRNDAAMLGSSASRSMRRGDTLWLCIRQSKDKVRTLNSPAIAGRLYLNRTASTLSPSSVLTNLWLHATISDAGSHKEDVIQSTGSTSQILPSSSFMMCPSSVTVSIE